ncbi:hypothetical protein GO986_09130 [Deinococcus sp. HMF7620]|uniref:Uncharacterized protein n=1 Tax=Deinococcus arboris TaxID=2682977 RepID=A0A7C9HRR4_9DEIO|nr:hypothetical protein [Deinococcus arboris]MVN86927.1 hypothetical protein [Deinococcus arboris]
MTLIVGETTEAVVIIEVETPEPVTTEVDGVAGIGPAGPTGPQGPPGPSSDVVMKTALEALGGHQIVALRPGGVQRADCGDLTTADAVLGVSTAAAASGTPVPVQRAGTLIEPSWTWTPGLVLLGHNGLPTQTLPPDAACLLVVGVAIDAHTLLVALHEPIVLSE